ncbi:MAG TPA: type II toxin-antitoxin system VapC family toxin [Spirochaetota bacterium]|jgi:tRNA(fMet)-specific endonuclease VapC|nr:type II toxin-antitoxin system VapC family toxin [Spirochaetota bacterium]HQO22713.1 type II toxin-antitoxin system VapC family toxin [Spirochaetota bacterium]HQQ23117.1 type II toxin-antitoxin system VapC family toxin [Spirochaetota bacterium]
MYYLDTNICVYFLKGKYPQVMEKIKKINPIEIKIASIVKAELLYGAEKSQNKETNKNLIIKFLEPFEIKDFDDKCTIEYSKIRSALELKGTTIGPNDYIIASTVLSNDGILITNNVDEFKRIKNLRIENWTK